MTDVITDLTAGTGLSPDSAQKGLGAVLGFFKDKLPADTFAKISGAVPGADGMMADPQTGAESSGGILGAVKGMAGKLFGGGGELVARLTQLGLSAEQIQAFLPRVLEFFKSRLPADVMDKIAGLLPASKQPVA